MATFRMHKAFSDANIALDYQGDMSALNSAIKFGVSQEADTGRKGPVTNWAAQEVINDRKKTKSQVLSELDSLPVSPGDRNPFWRAIQSEQRLLGAPGIKIVGDVAEMEVLGEYWWQPKNIGLFMQVEHAEALGIPVWFEVDEANYQDLVPASLPGSTWVDENEVEQTHTWESWNDGHHPRQGPWAGKMYVPANSMGEELLATVWYPLYASPPTGVVVLSQAEFKVIQQANQPEEA